MRLVVSSLIVLCLTAGSISHAQAPHADANAILALAREALGGEKKLAAVKNFVATGGTRQVSGINLVPIVFELFCELPDKFVRVDEIPARESGPTSTGFVGDTIVQLPAPPEMPAAAMAAAAAAAAGRAPAGATPPGAAAPGTPATPGARPAPGAAPGAAVPPGGAAAPAGAPPGAAAGMPGAAGPGGPGGAAAAKVDPKLMRVMMAKQEFAKLTLGMFAASFSSYPLTFTYMGDAEAPQGKADIIDVKGPGNFAIKFFINDETHLPIMVSWTTPTTNVILDVPGVPKPETIPPGSIIVPAPAPPARDRFEGRHRRLREDAAGPPEESPRGREADREPAVLRRLSRHRQRHQVPIPAPQGGGRGDHRRDDLRRIQDQHEDRSAEIPRSEVTGRTRPRPRLLRGRAVGFRYSRFP